MYDPTDERGVPISSGIPKLVTISGIVGIIVIFIVAGLVLSQAHYGHIWPAAQSVDLKL